MARTDELAGFVGAAAERHSPAEQVQRLAEILAAGGAAVSVHIERGAGHGLTQNDLATVAQWMRETAGRLDG